jgi:hypothetical protein
MKTPAMRVVLTAGGVGVLLLLILSAFLVDAIRRTGPAPSASNAPVEPPRRGDARVAGHGSETLRTLIENKDFQQALTYLLSLPPDQQVPAALRLFDAWAFHSV